MDRDESTRSFPAFRPSNYSAGLQPVLPYTQAWPEGSMYGEPYGSWFDYTPAGYIWGKLKESGAVDDARGTVIEKGEEALDYLKEQQEEVEREERAARFRSGLIVASTVLAGVAGVVFFNRYRKTGKVM